MSTRVQKGGTIFKPVAKARPRPAAANGGRASATPDPQRSNASNDLLRDPATPAPSSSSMPPPSIIPSKPAPPADSQNIIASRSDQVQELSEHSVRDPSISTRTINPPRLIQPVMPTVSTPSSVQPSQPTLPLPQSQIATHSASAAVYPTPNMPVPLVVGSRATPISSARSTPAPPLVQTNHHNLTESSPSTHLQLPLHHLPTFQPSLPSQLGSSSLPLPNGELQFDFSSMAPPELRLSNGQSSLNREGSTTYRLQLTSEIVVNSLRPRRQASKKSANTAEGRSENVSEPSEARTRRPRARKPAEGLQDPITSEAGLDGPRRKRRTRKVAVAEVPEHGEEDSEPAAKKRKRKTSGGTRGRKKSRAASLSPYDPDADPGEELDPTVTTMAALCEDSGQGRVSSKAAQIFDNHATWKRTNRERRARMRAIMEARKYGKNEDEVEAEGARAEPAAAGPSDTTASSSTHHIAEIQKEIGEEGEDIESHEGFDYSQSVHTSRFNVKVRIGPNGETILDEESLYVDRAEEDDTENYAHVEESDATKFVNSASYGKKFRGCRWSAEETELFYEALSQFGENYELISYVLPGRDRKSCKNKFKAEDKKNPNRITYCLNNRIPYDMQTLTRMTGKDFSGPTPIISAPARPNLSQLNSQTAQASGVTADSANRDEQPDSAAAGPSNVKAHGNAGKKKGRKKQDDGVEVLGAIDDADWDAE